MKTISNTEPAAFESTYALIVRSEEKQRGRFEILIYATLIASALLAVSQFGNQAAKMPLGYAHAPVIVSPSEQKSA
jgi:hypothetical protein